MPRSLPREVSVFLEQSGLVGANVPYDSCRLEGGVSSDIWLITTRGQKETSKFCVKRALAVLKVADQWEASTSRNSYEVEWFKTVQTFLPNAIPKILAHNARLGFFAMEYLDPGIFFVWKSQLRDGVLLDKTAVTLATHLAAIHSHTAYDDELAVKFNTDELFYDLRLNAYLVTAANRNPDVADAINKIVKSTQSHKIALVHGDISPKNILVDSVGHVVILDAETAWYGDPAFDVGFLLNHLLLKSLWKPENKTKYIRLFDLFWQTYLEGVTWEPRSGIESRIAHILPALLLARVDGKSPAEYITDDREKNHIRAFAKTYLLNPVSTLQTISENWLSTALSH